MKKLRITIGDQVYDVTVEVLEDQAAAGVSNAPTPAAPPVNVAPPVTSAGSAPPPAAGPVARGSVCSPMSGSVKSVQVKTGDQVEEGQVLLILDAMKMENKVTAPSKGAVTSVNVKEGDSVVEGQVLFVLESAQ